MLGFGVIPCDQSTARKLEIREGASVYEVKRIRLADDIPMAYEISYLPADFINGLTEDIMSASLYDYVENTLSLTIDRAANTRTGDCLSGRERASRHRGRRTSPAH